MGRAQAGRRASRKADDLGRAAWRTERAIARFLGVSDEAVAEFEPHLPR